MPQGWTVVPEASGWTRVDAPPTPAPTAATTGMLGQSTAKGDPLPPGFMPDEDWAKLQTGEKLRNMAEWGGKQLAGMMGMNAPGPVNPGVDAVEHPGMTLASAALPLVARKLPGAAARVLGISKIRGGQNIEAATQAARAVPLNVEKVGQEGLRAIELQQAGASMPRAASQFMQRITHPAKTDLTFGEARDFYSNISRLSAKETSNLNPVMRRQIVAMREALHDALVEGADTVGKGEQYASGMKEYARSAKAVTLAKRAAKATGIGLTADYLLKRVSSIVR